jgi:LysM repeat protein
LGERIETRFYPEEGFKNKRRARRILIYSIAFAIVNCILICVNIVIYTSLQTQSKLPIGKRGIVKKNVLDRRINYQKTSISDTLVSYVKNSIDKLPICHKVSEGETLYSIAKAYRVSLDSLKITNNLTDNIIKSGTLLKIPNKK